MKYRQEREGKKRRPGGGMVKSNRRLLKRKHHLRNSKEQEMKGIEDSTLRRIRRPGDSENWEWSRDLNTKDRI